jgi:hypothetical protein
MTALEPIIAAVLGSGLTAGIVWLVKLLNAKKILKYGTIVARAYDIVDPLLESNMKSWKGSDVEFAIELAVKSVSDGEITPTEMKTIVREISARWLPAVAADKVRKYVTSDTVPVELKAAETLAKVVNGQDNKDAAIATVKTLLKNG